MISIPNMSRESPPTLSTIGYINEFGDDELHIPPRPFLVPGVQDVKGKIVAQLAAGARKAMDGDLGAIQKGFEAAGLLAQAAVKQRLRDGPFTPLSPKTVAARARRRDPDTGKLVNSVSTRAARKYRQLQREGVPTDVLNEVGLATPLIDTGALLGSIISVIKG